MMEYMVCSVALTVNPANTDHVADDLVHPFRITPQLSGRVNIFRRSRILCEYFGISFPLALYSPLS